MHNSQTKSDSAWAVFLVFLSLGLTSFGGPIAHLAYFREEFVTRRKWLSEQRYVDLVALCQFLPGPASSQVGFAIGLRQAGYRGAIAAWLGFTMPSAILLILLALGLSDYNNLVPAGVLNGLKVVAVAVVAQAVWGMAKNLCPDLSRRLIMVLSAALLILIPSLLTQVAVIIIGAITGWLLYKDNLIGNSSVDNETHSNKLVRMPIPKKSLFFLSLFFILLIGLPLISMLLNSQTIDVIGAFYRSGSLVFGGGHVVLPLLQAETVNTAWLTNDAFLAGYGATQAVPGPLFTFAAFLGTSMSQSPNGISGGLLCLVVIFLPSLLLLLGVLPFWETLRSIRSVQASLAGINATVVGILLAALYHPIWSTAIIEWPDLVLALIALVALIKLKLAPWLVVLGCAVGGWLIQLTLGIA